MNAQPLEINKTTNITLSKGDIQINIVYFNDKISIIDVIDTVNNEHSFHLSSLDEFYKLFHLMKEAEHLIGQEGNSNGR